MSRSQSIAAMIGGSINTIGWAHLPLPTLIICGGAVVTGTAWAWFVARMIP